ncbi:hypothetical protein B9Z55_007212 [Caenorhabditis nigoni]|uniref:Peptidase M13 C-terminal domain-containing protein n=1 Tax=Caenorhabditis nigoni TaxID=1611254 RepID=A0A2G5V8K0_9PELO|nr:hypothetical protein B9Z55_007212 [Caenorhabditis nigoni]
MHHLFAKCQEMADPTKQSDFFQEWRSDVEQIGWPMLNPNWNDNLFDLTGLLRKTAVINLDNGFTINYGIFSLLIPVARKVFIGANSPHATNFYEIQKVLNTIFPESSRPAHLDMLREVQEVHWFGLELQKIDALTPQRHILDVENNYEALKAAFPGLNFDYLISDLLSNHVLSWNKIKNKIYGARGFLEKAPHINTLVQNYKRAAGNYFVYQYVRNSYIYGATLEKSKCEQLVPLFLPLPSLRVFVRNHFDKEAIKDVDNLVESIRSSFIEMLQNSEWAHEKLKNGAIRKAKIMKKLISYPQELETPGALDKHFNIHLDSSVSYYWTMKRIERASINPLLDYVSSDFPMNPVFGFMSNAVYTRADNTINVLAPIMDEPLFHTSFPNYAKIAGIGFVIGHEIGHGFDAEGILFDENGKQQILFDGNDSMEYAKKITCLINQYNNYDDPSFGRKLNGSTTIMELLADEIGQDAAWRTFKKLDLSQEKKIIGFEDLSFEKLYFRIGALKWCSPRSPLTLEDQLKQVHATTSFRVNGVFANEKGFAEAFNCSAGSPMNPVKKCTMF